MGVDLLGVLLLQAEDHLDGGQCLGAIIGGPNELLVGRDRQLCGVLEDVGDGFFAINVFLHDAVLEYTDSCEQIEGLLVSFVNTIEDEADDDLLPGRATLVPECRLLKVDNLADVLHDTVKSTCHENLVLVVVRDGNQELSMSVIHPRTQIVTILEGEVVGIASSGRVAHSVELASARFRVTVLGLNGIADGTWHGVVDAQDGALDELDLSGLVALDAARGDSLCLLTAEPAVFNVGSRVDGGRGPAVSEAGLLERTTALVTIVVGVLTAVLRSAGGLLGVRGGIGLCQAVSRDGAVCRVGPSTEAVLVVWRVVAKKMAGGLILILVLGVL